MIQFDTGVFFELALPAILFAAGFNMRRKEFFKNFVNITKFGIFGSLFTYFFYVLLTWLLFTCVEMTMWDPTVNDFVPFNLTLLEIMLVCSILVSSDIIAAMTILNFDETPNIFSIVVGEGLQNDVVVIILFTTVSNFHDEPGKAFTARTFFQIIGSFISLCLISVFIGILSGFIISYILKKVRAISHSAIHETFLLLSWAFLTYYVSEILS